MRQKNWISLEGLEVDRGFHSLSAAVVVKLEEVVTVTGELWKRVEGQDGAEVVMWLAESSQNLIAAF